MTIRHTDKTRDTERVGVDQGEVTFDGGEQVATGTRRTLATLVQARLDVSQPSDLHELEAERLAADFVSTTHGRSGHVSQPAPTALARSTGQGLDTTGSGLTTTDETAHAINAASGGGHGLPDGTLNSFEQFFGTDLSGVRIHAGGQADTLCRSIEAQAFTKGNDVFFASGQYAPGTAGGDHLLAHELTHVVQQGAPAISRIWSLDPRKWGKTEEEIEQEKKDAFVAKMEQREASMEHTTINPLYADDADEEQGPTPDGSNKKESDDTRLAKNVENVTQSLSAGGKTTTGGLRVDALEKGKLNEFGYKDLGPNQSPEVLAKESAAAVGGSLVGLFVDLAAFVKALESGSYTDKVEKAVTALESAISTTSAALKVAAGAGSVAGQLVPGLGLAASVISIARKAVRFYYMNKGAALMEEAAKEKTTATSAESSDFALAAGTIGARAKRQRNIEMAQIVGDLVIAAGQITALTGVGGPWGAAVSAAGVFIKGGTALVTQIARWVEAEQTKQARDRVANAEAALKDAEKKKDSPEEIKEKQDELTEAKRAQLKVDAYEATREVLKRAVQPGPDGKADPVAVAKLNPFGLRVDKVQQYIDSGGNPQLFDEMANSIVRYIGSSPDPLTWYESLRGIGLALGSAAKKGGRVIAGVATLGLSELFIRTFGKKPPTVTLDVLSSQKEIIGAVDTAIRPLLTSTMLKNAKGGVTTVEAIKKALEKVLENPVKQLRAMFNPGDAKGTNYAGKAAENDRHVIEYVGILLKAMTYPPGIHCQGYDHDGKVLLRSGRERSNAVTGRPVRERRNAVTSRPA
ncbi:MAG: DUF4157 domain-containing protein [Actinomycetota bacterium]|nr:DUF4157 domain-containing protein [Actinomycetota bacterium]